MFLGYNCMSSILDIIGEYDDFLDQQQGYRIVILFLKLKYEHYSGWQPNCKENYRSGSDLFAFLIYIVIFVIIYWNWLDFIPTPNWGSVIVHGLISRTFVDVSITSEKTNGMETQSLKRKKKEKKSSVMLPYYYSQLAFLLLF